MYYYIKASSTQQLSCVYIVQEGNLGFYSNSGQQLLKAFVFALHRDRKDVYISYFFVLVNTIKFDEYILVTFVVQRGFERSTNFFLQVKRISFFFVAARQWLVNKSSCSSLLALKGSLWRDDLEVHLKYRGQLRLFSINPPKQFSAVWLMILECEINCERSEDPPKASQKLPKATLREYSIKMLTLDSI